MWVQFVIHHSIDVKIEEAYQALVWYTVCGVLQFNPLL